ncbi:MAG: DUF2950 domain-containing protein [Verrucomicrobia bacterium]|nr:MAG: DUF2950 domain-containing protein [Verrucomicrobiota bacterium]
MKLNISTSKQLLALVTLAGCVTLAVQAAPPTEEKAADPGNRKQFDDPKKALDSLVQAAETFDVAALKEILGPDSEDIINSEDPVMDKQNAMKFAAKAKEKNAIVPFVDNPNRAAITFGTDEAALPIPLVKDKGKWSFDTNLGREEILNRRIGANELDAITICRGFVEAQHEYAQEKHEDSKVNQYAQRIISTPGKKDGLAWQNADGTWGGPVGDTIAKAIEQGYSDKTEPYHGYYFKVLKGQGPTAPMGEMDFVINGAMLGGFALVASPAEHQVTGVKSFIVGPEGVVYEKDLGPETLKEFATMERYNPDKTWKATDDDWPEEEDEPGDQTPAATPAPKA